MPGGYPGRVSAWEREEERTAVLPPVPPVATTHESWLPYEHPLHRPRHSARQRTAQVCAALFFCAPLIGLVVGVPVEELENRRLTSFPAVTSGWEFFSGLQPWANDHLPFRGDAIHAADGVSRGVFGEPPPFNQQEGATSAAGSGTVVGPVAPPQQADRDTPSSAGFSTVIEGSDGWLYLGYDIRAKCRPSRSLDEVITQLRRLKQSVEASGRRFALVVAPDKSTLVPEHLPRGYAGRECAATASSEFWRRVTTEVGAIDLREPLRDAGDDLGRPVYFPLDTHWTFEGGLTMTRTLADSIQRDVSRTWKVTPGTPWRDEADLPQLIGRTGENQSRHYALAPDGNSDRTARSASDFRTALHLTSSPMTGTISRSVAMLADSYTQFATPFLGAAFNDITILHVETALSDAAGVANVMANSEVVVVEVVERHLATGASPISDPLIVDAITQTLAQHPRR